MPRKGGFENVKLIGQLLYYHFYLLRGKRPRKGDTLSQEARRREANADGSALICRAACSAGKAQAEREDHFIGTHKGGARRYARRLIRYYPIFVACEKSIAWVA